MFPGSTLFFDVGVQCDLWPDGSWPLMTEEQAANVSALCATAVELGIRQGGTLCVHVASSPADESGGGSLRRPPHCLRGTVGASRAPACVMGARAEILPCDAAVAAAGLALDRTRAFYIASGCIDAPDATDVGARVVEHLTAGIRNAVVFGAGVEYGVDRAVDMLLRRRIRTHAVLDAAGAGDGDVAQRVIAGWKRRAVDGVTTATLRRLLRA